MYNSCKDDIDVLKLLLQASVCLICMTMIYTERFETGCCKQVYNLQEQVKYSPSLSLPRQQDAFTAIWVLYDGSLHSKLR